MKDYHTFTPEGTRMTELLAHSPLGGSGTHRWMECPGSVGLSQGIEDEESEYAAAGTAAHAVAEYAIISDSEPWFTIGQHYSGHGKTFYPAYWAKAELPDDAVPIDKEMVDAVQDYITALGEWHPDRNQGNFWVERKFHCPSIHEYMYGQSDATYLDLPARALHVWDYKHGAGIVVEVKRNPQCMYYACGVLEDLDLWTKVDKVVLHIAQPRGYHFDGPIRSWSISTSDLEDWMLETLVPAMDRALVSRDTKSGEHCRFCPARSRACPQIINDMDDLEMIMEQIKGKSADELPNVEINRFLDLLDVAKIVGKAAEKTAFNRLNAGKGQGINRSLVNKRSNREWKEGATEAAVSQFGKKKAFTTPELKSPAQFDGMPGGVDFTAQYAHKPDKGLTLGKKGDARVSVSKDTKSLFTDQTKKGKK